MMFYIEHNQKILENAYPFLNHGAVSDFISRILRLDNPNLLDDYNKAFPLFLVKYKFNFFLGSKLTLKIKKEFKNESSQRFDKNF